MSEAVEDSNAGSQDAAASPAADHAEPVASEPAPDTVAAVEATPAGEEEVKTVAEDAVQGDDATLAPPAASVDEAEQSPQREDQPVDPPYEILVNGDAPGPSQAGPDAYAQMSASSSAVSVDAAAAGAAVPDAYVPPDAEVEAEPEAQEVQEQEVTPAASDEVVAEPASTDDAQGADVAVSDAYGSGDAAYDSTFAQGTDENKADDGQPTEAEVEHSYYQPLDQSYPMYDSLQSTAVGGGGGDDVGHLRTKSEDLDLALSPQQSQHPPRPSLVGLGKRPPPPLPPLPSTDGKPSQAEAGTIRYYLKQAMQSKNYQAMRDLITKAEATNLGEDDLVVEARAQLSEVDSSRNDQEIETIKIYLKQAMDLKSRGALKIALEKAKGIKGSTNRMHADFNILVDQAKAMLASLDTESGQTLAHYIKQGIALRNRELLKESYEKAALLKPGLVSKELMDQAGDVLRRLDAEYLVVYYLDTAMKAKDAEALETAIGKASALKLPDTHEKLKEAKKMYGSLSKKKPGTSESKSLPVKGHHPGKLKSFFRKDSSKKDEKKSTHLFGGLLEDAVSVSEFIVPKICFVCIEYLKAHGLDEAGLFRVPGNKDAMEVIKNSFEADDEVKLTDVNDAGGILKLYLRNLPEPLIPYSLYKEFIAIGNKYGTKDPKRLVELHTLLAKLPLHSKNMLSYLAYFLHELSLHETVNKMNANNLAIVFAPNLLRPEIETPDSMLMEMPQSISVISSIIQHPKECLPELGSLRKPEAPV